jgi:hypothetical protein
MRSGGTIDVQTVNADLRQIKNGTYPPLAVVKLPLPNVFYVQQPDWGLAPLSNYFSQIRDLQIVELPIPQTSNFFSLVQYAISESGDLLISSSSAYGVSPFNFNAGEEYSPTCWTGGFLRVNGAGPWILVTDADPWAFGIYNQTPISYEQGGVPSPSGFAVFQMPISRLEWAGICIYGNNPDPFETLPTPYMVALLGINFTAQGADRLVGKPSTYAVPGGSGPENVHIGNNPDGLKPPTQGGIAVP